MENSRETLNIVVVGHVDHGKSTLIGRLLFDTDSLPEGAIDKVKQLAKEKGKAFEYAYLLDAFEEEQEQGITIDTTQLQFSTEKRDYVIIDAPGHKEFLKNMISGAANAEAAFLLVDANEGIQEQSRRHGYILSLLGIKKVYVIVNKMDLVDYSEDRLNQIKTDFNEFLNNLNIYPIDYIPISAYFGENIVKKSKKMPWNRSGSIIEIMDTIPKDKDLEKKPLRFPIQDVYKFDDRRIIAGRIESGTLNVGDEILISPSNKTTKIKSIAYWSDKDQRNEASAGMSVGIIVEDEFFNKRGEIISHIEDAPIKSNIFNANVFWMGKTNLVKNKKYKLKLSTKEVECEVITINKIIDASTLAQGDFAEGIKKNDVAEVTIRTKEMICFDEFANLQTTGRFVIVDGFDVSGGGIISGIEDSLKNRELVTNSTNIAPRKRLVSTKDREKSYGQKGRVIWLTGLSGSGKNEIAIKLEKKLFDFGKKVYYLDSTNLRFGLSSDLEFSAKDAHEQTRRIAEVARLFADSGTIVIVSSVSRYRKDREFAKEIIGESVYREVFIEATEDVCKKRNPGGIYEDGDENFYYEKSDYPVFSLFIEDAEFNADKKALSLIELIRG
ncbi:sulfate adenylyltransferase subunit 1 [Natranaerovirga pectinivora]|uniref:Sulfate adenylyltransferase subunit 1 n=1 Tax=Natranaerovirga pectinivora TaxID=682400 RepID=A0A4R3MJL3_9FIRM|nr:adenylyl-sulfate kinase [Natranaerovirga pectinivora]TCT14246.1 sulfate adenylyltransferase subunit 1 [Natranaerovirga pectinivora]